MLTATTIVDEILDLKKQRRATLLAHHYQQPEIQELADVIGDSLELARKARELEGDTIAFCGVWFMAETAKVLNPNRIVVVPDREASFKDGQFVIPLSPQAAAPRPVAKGYWLMSHNLRRVFKRGEMARFHVIVSGDYPAATLAVNLW